MTPDEVENYNRKNHGEAWMSPVPHIFFCQLHSGRPSGFVAEIEHPNGKPVEGYRGYETDEPEARKRERELELIAPF